jgi:hypothetical protein
VLRGWRNAGTTAWLGRLKAEFPPSRLNVRDETCRNENSPASSWKPGRIPRYIGASS